MPTAGTFVHRPVTPSGSKGTFYFAYGSNLSPTQMSIRCKSAPRSSIPIAVARLRGWKWHICERGSANIVYTGGVGLQNETWGLVYDLDVEDEKLLDYWEGVDWQAPQVMDNGARSTTQGRGRHNKLYLEAEIVRWNSNEWEDRLGKENPRARIPKSGVSKTCRSCLPRGRGTYLEGSEITNHASRAGMGGQVAS